MIHEKSPVHHDYTPLNSIQSTRFLTKSHSISFFSDGQIMLLIRIGEIPLYTSIDTIKSHDPMIHSHFSGEVSLKHHSSQGKEGKIQKDDFVKSGLSSVGFRRVVLTCFNQQLKPGPCVGFQSSLWMVVGSRCRVINRICDFDSSTHCSLKSLILAERKECFPCRIWPLVL